MSLDFFKGNLNLKNPTPQQMAAGSAFLSAGILLFLLAILRWIWVPGLEWWQILTLAGGVFLASYFIVV
ncbi:MAG: hypothetical protein AAB316_08565, partial [Bacteroidota bacterium]